jgi:type IV pilus assembly protein PilY1
MTRSIVVRACLVLLACGLARPSAAEDTDIFAPRADLTPGVPTIIFVLDNTSNWSRQANGWPSGTQGSAELNAISAEVAALNKPVNIGLMMFTTATNTSNNSGPNGAYVRFAARSMLAGSPLTATAANTALRSLAAQMVSNINSTGEKVADTQGIIANAMYEAWLYITGRNSWAGMDRSADYNNNSNRGNGANQIYPPYRIDPSLGNWAYASGNRNARYNPPQLNGCGQTYIVFIGNNRQGGGTGSFPSPGATDPSVTTLRSYNYTTAPGGYYQGTWARFLNLRPDLGPPGSNAATSGRVITYTIDAYNAQQNAQFSTMLKDMKQQGGGEYYQAGSETALRTAINEIFTRILAANSAFASVALPVSVNQRGSYLNQVYLGVFRPDAERAPNWAGNLKQYQIAVRDTLQGQTLYLADASSPPQSAAAGNFISPTALSFWTTSSSFWSSTYYPNSQGVGGVSDAPDGDLVEKGGAAQKLRTTYATDQAARSVYTCVGSGCTAGAALSSMPFNSSLSATDAPHTAFNSTDATNVERNAIINWVRGANNRTDDNPSGSSTDIRGFVHGDVIHSRPVVINYNRCIPDCANRNDVYVFYGANDGLFRALKGGRADDGGAEQWAFVPSEGFDKLKRLRDHTPLIADSGLTNRKPYFLDGSPTVYTFSTSNDGTIDYAQDDKAYLYLTARRGGRFMYALDISNPTAPALLWKHTNSDTGFSELGQTWSELKVGRIRGQTDPVVIFGLGYDPVANDSSVVPAQATMGRGVMILNARTGAKVWSTEDASGANRNGTNQYAIAAGVAQVDTDFDGYVDRVIAADTGGNIWRINVDYTDATTNPNNLPGSWTIDKVAALGAASGSNARKFLGAPDVVVASTSGVPVPYDTILIGSGDREQPFDTSITNRFYMLKDEHSRMYRYTTPLTESDLFDTTNNLIQQGTAEQQAAATVSLNNARGWYITLAAGEKVDGPSTTLSGATFFGTNTPADGDENSCVANLGTARTYAVNYLTGGAVIHLDGNLGDALNADDRSQVIPGGGFPPPPVALQVDIGGTSYQGVAFGPNILQPSGAGFGRRYREWWYQNTDD